MPRIYDAFETIPIAALDSVAHGRIWHAFLEGLGLDYVKPTRGNITESIRAVIEAEGITPIRVAEKLGMEEHYVTGLLTGSFKDKDANKARELGALIQYMRRVSEPETVSAAVCPGVDAMLQHLFYEPNNFQGMNVGQAVQHILTKEGMTAQSAADALAIPPDALQGLISRSEKSEEAAAILGKSLGKAILSAEAQKEAIAKTVAPVSARIPAEKKSSGYFVSAPPLLPAGVKRSVGIAAKSLKQEEGEFAQWVRSLNRNPKELAKKWSYPNSIPIFKPEEITAMKAGRLVPTVPQFVFIVEAERIKSAPVKKKLVDALLRQRDLIAQNKPDSFTQSR